MSKALRWAGDSSSKRRVCNADNCDSLGAASNERQSVFKEFRGLSQTNHYQFSSKLFPCLRGEKPIRLTRLC